MNCVAAFLARIVTNVKLHESILADVEAINVVSHPHGLQDSIRQRFFYPCPIPHRKRKVPKGLMWYRRFAMTDTVKQCKSGEQDTHRDP